MLQNCQKRTSPSEKQETRHLFTIHLMLIQLDIPVCIKYTNPNNEELGT